MRLLFTIDPKDYDPDGKGFVRDSARARIVRGGKIAMVHSLKYDYYKFPGGGIDEGEFIEEALRRELVEEAGYEVSIVSPLGRVIEERHWSNMHGVDFYFLCHPEKAVANRLTDGETEKGLKLVWFDSIDDAIEYIKDRDSDFVEEWKRPFFIARDAAALNEAKRVLKMRKFGRGSLGGQHG